MKLRGCLELAQDGCGVKIDTKVYRYFTKAHARQEVGAGAGAGRGTFLCDTRRVGTM